MADISEITLPSGVTYDIKDATARNDISMLKGSGTGAMHYAGVTTTALANGSSASPIKINEADYTPSNGDVVIYEQLEFVWSTSDKKWHEFGSTGSLKGLAFKDSASASYTPAGSVSAPTVSVAVNTAKVAPITGVGTLPNFTATVSNETLTLGFSAGSLPTKGEEVTVATGIKSASASAPAFKGTSATITTK
jgi:hypothetical protein|nr:MAG TPA: hypothetical protein [Caudoviricetes sp.]